MPISHQTVRLGPGRHPGPGSAVCVMELASMLAGDRFTDRPACVCPLVGAILRGYNDWVDDDRRQDLYRFAAAAIGTRGSFELQHQRAEVGLAFARAGFRSRPWWRRRPAEPPAQSGPEEIADYVLASIGRRIDDSDHSRLLALLDRLIAVGGDRSVALAGEFVEQPVHAVEHARREQQLLV